MISNLSIAVKMNKYKPDTDHTAVVEYATAEDAEQAAAASLKIDSAGLEAEVISYSPDKKKKPLTYKSKAYIGNLPEDFQEENLTKIIAGTVSPKTVFLSKPTQSQKKYAFLEFSDETERNVALGVLEKIKQGGALGADAIVSPAYPYTQRPKHRKHVKPASQ
ncbi:hypothetical protein NEMIN01_1137 [Nematocida minor]|uniref:uncharacterized protein n=1 Tax=Nematocida minor TaxID=1912983 RepID=UPI0022201B42|nr:uncharacterized protein NEMIN01_1137 [Nematocida minor]KAI5190672.1 hypothetical protein NEMIN01_1137 [Nematocida minor]